MLDYMAELMEDAHDFSWTSAKASHALLLCRMKEGKVTWKNTDKIDRIRQANAQKIVNSGGIRNQDQGRPKKVAICKFFQRKSCTHARDHMSGGISYRHICIHCKENGKTSTHPGSDCRIHKSKNKQSML